MSFQPATKEDLQTAVDNWVLLPNGDISTYNNVPINNWNTILYSIQF
jgi:hypothetical protein